MTDKYLNILFFDNKVKETCTPEKIATLLGLDPTSASRVYCDLIKRNLILSYGNYYDEIFLTPLGLEQVLEFRKGKSFKIIRFIKSFAIPRNPITKCERAYGFIFWYELIEQNGKMTNYEIKVLISESLAFRWGLYFGEFSIKSSEKISLLLTKDYISEKLASGDIKQNEKYELTPFNQPEKCPYTVTDDFDIMFMKFEVEAANSKREIVNSQIQMDVIKHSNNESPTVFISYSWDDDSHKAWVLNLSKRLFEKGVNVLLDQLELSPGRNLIHFMESSIPKSKKVLIIFTPNYKLKAEKREGGVGFEYSILNAELYTKISSNDKFIPILKAGKFLESIPVFMQQFIAIDMTKQTDFEDRFNELIYAIYDKPQIEKPKTGSHPFKDQPNNAMQETTIEILKELKIRTRYLWTGLKEFKGGDEQVKEEIKESTFNAIESLLNRLCLQGLMTFEKTFLFEMITTREKVYLLTISNISIQLKDFVHSIESGHL